MPKLAFAPGALSHGKMSGTTRTPSTSGFRVNFILLAVVAALVIYGLIVLYSVTLVDSSYSFARQLVGVGAGVIVCIVIAIFDYRKLSEWFVPLLVAELVCICLPMVPGFGVEVNGATSWVKIGPLPQFQPSEFAKPLSILVVAAMAARCKADISHGKDYLKIVGLIVVPFIFLFREDLGTAFVILITGFIILFVGGAKRRWILLTVLVFVVGAVGLFVVNGFVSDFTGGSVQLIKPYQMSRLLVFIDQDNPDYADDAYNLNQAKIAVGSGEVSGKGWGNATQSSGGFLPESATDFIFCVAAETYGFMGSFLLICLYLALLAVAFSIGLRSSDLFGSLIACGIMGMWLFQILENIGMDIGLMPITGIPLPFMSYGSSFMLMNFICVGLLSSVWSRRNDVTNTRSKSSVKLGALRM